MVNGRWCLDSDCPQLSESADSKSADNDKRCSEFEELSYKLTNWNSFCALKLAIMTGFEEQTCNCTRLFVLLWNPAIFFVLLLSPARVALSEKRHTKYLDLIIKSNVSRPWTTVRGNCQSYEKTVRSYSCPHWVQLLFISGSSSPGAFFFSYWIWAWRQRLVEWG